MNAISLVRLSALAFLMLITLSGCVTRYVDRIVTKTEYVVVTPESHYLKNTPVPTPPEKVTYAPGDVPDFEQLYKDQSIANIRLYKAIGMCNADKYGATQDIAAKKKAYD